jgi:hypothetical protein
MKTHTYTLIYPYLYSIIISTEGLSSVHDDCVKYLYFFLREICVLQKVFVRDVLCRSNRDLHCLFEALSNSLLRIDAVRYCNKAPNLRSKLPHTKLW